MVRNSKIPDHDSSAAKIPDHEFRTMFGAAGEEGEGTRRKGRMGEKGKGGDERILKFRIINSGP